MPNSNGSTNLVNPGSVYQTYNPGTGVTTYGSAPAGTYQGTGAAVATPQNLPSGQGTPQVAQQKGSFVDLNKNTAFVETPTGIMQNTNGVYDFKMPSVIPSTALKQDSLNEASKVISQAQKQAVNQQSAQFGQPRNLDTERSNATQLHQLLSTQKAGDKPLISMIDRSQWPALVNAMTYGGYSAKDIANNFYSKATGKGDIFNFSQSRAEWKPNVPGSKPEVPDTQNPASPEVANDDGTIDPVKLANNIYKTIQDINQLIADERASFDNTVNELGNQTGEAMPLIQGEQAYIERQKEVRLTRLVEMKNAAIESGNLQLKAYDYAQQLRKDQQEALATMIDMNLKAGVPISKNIAEQYSKMTGMDAQFIEDSFAVAAKNYLAQNKADNDLKQAQIKQASLPDTSVVEVNGRKILIDSKTGKTIKDLGAVPTAGAEAPTIKSINGTDKQWNPATQTWESPSGANSSTPVDSQKIAEAQSMITDLDELMKIRDWTGALPVGARAAGQWVAGTEAYNFAAKLEGILGKETLKNMGLIKGVLSNSDMELLKSASTGGLKQGVGEKQFTETVDKLKNAAQSVINSPKMNINQVIYNDDGSTQSADNGDDKHTGTYSYKNNDGTVHTGKIGETYKDPTVKPKPNFSSVGSDTNKAAVATLMNIPDQVKGGQCGHFVNQITGIGVGDSYQSKISKMDPTITKPAPGMIFTMPYKDTGHVGFIVGIDGKNAIVKDSNYGLDEQIKTHVIPISNMTGFRALS